MFDRTRRIAAACRAGFASDVEPCGRNDPSGPSRPGAACGSRTALADGGDVEVPLTDWEAIEEHLRRFGRSGQVDVGEDRITLSVGSSHVTVHRHGRVETGMPLHEFVKDDVETLQFDHEAGHFRVHGEDGLAYEFRRP